MAKRAATITNFVLIIGILIVALVAIVSLQRVAFNAGSQAEKDAAQAFIEKIKSTIERTNEYPSDAEYKIEVPFAEFYELNVTQNTISMYLRDQDIHVQTEFSNPNMNIIPSRIDSMGVIYVRRTQKNIYVSSE